MKFDKSKLVSLAKAGIFLTVISSLFHATGNLFSKYVSNEISTFNIVAVRYIFQCIFASPPIIKNVSRLKDVSKLEWFLIFSSGLFQFIASGCGFLALAILPIMDATTLLKIQPIFVNFLSWIWLKEMITWLDFMMTTVLMAGVIMVCEPAFLFNTSTAVNSAESLEWLGQLLAILAALTSGIATCMIRRIRNTGSSIILFWQAVFVVVLSLVAGSIMGHQLEPETLLGYLLVGAAALGESLFRVTLTAALMVEESAIVASFQTVEILFSLIYELTVFRVLPNYLDLTGAILIIAGVIILACKYKIIQAARCKCQTTDSIENSLDEKSVLLEK